MNSLGLHWTLFLAQTSTGAPEPQSGDGLRGVFSGQYEVPFEYVGLVVGIVVLCGLLYFVLARKPHD